MEQQGLLHSAERTNTDLLRRKASKLQLTACSCSQIQSAALWIGIRQQRTASFKCMAGLLQIPHPWQSSGHLQSNSALYLIRRTTHRRPKRHKQLRALAAHLLQVSNRLQKNPRRHPPPTGMAYRDATTDRISKKHRGAICSANPQALTTNIAHQTVGLRPGLSSSATGRKHASAVDLLRAMHADTSAEITSKNFRPTARPLAREETVFELLQQISLEVVTSVTAHPRPTIEMVEACIGLIKRSW